MVQVLTSPGHYGFANSIVLVGLTITLPMLGKFANIRLFPFSLILFQFYVRQELGLAVKLFDEYFLGL